MKVRLNHSLGSGIVLWMLDEAGAECELVFGRPAGSTGASTIEEAQGTTPSSSLPILNDGDLEIGEWAAIVLHVAERFPEKRLAPPVGSRERALYYQAIAQVAARVDPVLGAIPMRTRWGPEPKREVVLDPAMRKQLEVIARSLEGALAGRACIAGSTFTAADVVVGTAVAYLDFVGVLSGHPFLSAYARRVTERPAYQRTFAPMLRKATTVPDLFSMTTLRHGRAGSPLFYSARPNMVASDLAPVVAHVDTARPIYMLQFRYPEEPQLGRPYDRDEYAAWARQYLDRMRSVQPVGPYLLLGMCEGAQIAYEVARLLEAKGEEVALLGFIDTWTPENARVPFLARVRRVELALRSLAKLSAAEGAKQASAKAGRGLARTLARFGIKRPAGPRPSGKGTKEDHVEAQRRWQERAHPRTPVAIVPIRTRITLFRAVKQQYWMVPDPNLGWGNRTTGGVEICEVEGVHAQLLQLPLSAGLGERITLRLRQIVDETPGRSHAPLPLRPDGALTPQRRQP